MIKQCASKLKPYLAPALKSLGTTIDDYTKAVSEVLQVESEANDSQHAMAASKNAVIRSFPLNYMLSYWYLKFTSSATLNFPTIDTRICISMCLILVSVFMFYNLDFIPQD